MEIILQKAYPNDEVLNCDSKRFAQPGNPAAEFQLLARLKELRDLSMVNTGLSTLAGFPSLPNLIKLDLSDNRLTNINGLSKVNLSKLQSLILCNNKISDFSAISALQSMPSLRNLDMSDCPLANSADYREMIFSIVPGLKTLDGATADGIEVDFDDEEDDYGEPFDESEAGGEDLDSEAGDDREVHATVVKRSGGKTAGKGKYPTKTGGKTGTGKIPDKMNQGNGGKRPGIGKFPSKTGKSGSSAQQLSDEEELGSEEDGDELEEDEFEEGQEFEEGDDDEEEEEEDYDENDYEYGSDEGDAEEEYDDEEDNQAPQENYREGSELSGDDEGYDFRSPAPNYSNDQINAGYSGNLLDEAEQFVKRKFPFDSEGGNGGDFDFSSEMSDEMSDDGVKRRRQV